VPDPATSSLDPAQSASRTKTGVEQVLAATIKRNKDVSGLGEKEMRIIQYGRQLLRKKRSAPELTGTIANYVANGIVLDASRPTPAAGQTCTSTP